MLEEGNEPSRHAHHLARSHVDVLNGIGRNEHEVAPVAGDDRVPDDPSVLDRCVGGREMGLVLLVGPQPDDVVGELALRHLPVGRDQESIGIDARVDRQARDEPDVRALGRLDRADAAVVGDVNVSHLKARPLAIEAARAEGREPPLMREHRERIGLVHHLRQLTATEKVFDRRGDALGIDQRPRSHLGGILETHPLLDGPPQLEEALAEFVTGELVDRPQATVAEVVDVVYLDLPLPLAQLQHVPDGRDEVLRPEGHLRFRHAEPELAVDPESPHTAEPVAVCVVEFLVEQNAGLVEGGRIAGPQPLVDPHKGVFVARRHAGPPLRLVGILAEAVHDEGHLLHLHQLDSRQARRADQLRLVLGDRAASIHDDLAGPLAGLGIHNVIDSDFAHEFREASGP